MVDIVLKRPHERCPKSLDWTMLSEQVFLIRQWGKSAGVFSLSSLCVRHHVRMDCLFFFFPQKVQRPPEKKHEVQKEVRLAVFLGQSPLVLLAYGEVVAAV